MTKRDVISAATSPFSSASRTLRPRCLPWAILLSLGCDAECNETLTEPPRSARAELAAAADAGARPRLQQLAPTAAVPAAEATGNARPSIDENMGRGFQGSLELRLIDSRGTRQLRYLARGNTARFQLDGAPGQAGLDALVWSENVSLLDHERRSYRTRALDDVPPSAPSAGEVQVQKTGERVTMQGVICERYLIKDGTLQADACVIPVPGEIDVGKFEAVSRLDVPAWVERLLDEDLFPLSARVTQGNGKELYRLELIAYSAGPVGETQLSLPPGYTEVR